MVGQQRKRRRTNILPTTTLKKSTVKTPTRYDFNPSQPPETAPPVQPKVNRKPSVKDYPPATHLFNTPTDGASPSANHNQRRTTSASQLNPSLSPSQPSHSPENQRSSTSANPAIVTVAPGRLSQVSHHRAPAFSGNRQPSTSQPGQVATAQVSPTHSVPEIRSLSPNSSQAQNSHPALGLEESDEEEEYSDVEGIPEPNLSQEQLEALNSILLGPRPRKDTILDPDLLEPNSTWFGFDDSKLTRQITKCFVHKFDGPYYSYSCVPRDRIERWFVEFAKKHKWDPSLTGMVQDEFETILQARIKDMVSIARSLDKQPQWITDKIWTEMKAHWATDHQVSKRATTSRARMSVRKGLGPHKHTCGPKSYRQVGREMEVELGRPVSYGEIFIRANTKKDGTFVDKKAEQVAEKYKKQKVDKLSSLLSESTDVSDGAPPPELTVEEDNQLFLQSTFVNDRGDVFGIGSLKEDLLVKGKGKKPESLASFRKMQEELEQAKQQLAQQAQLLARQEEENSRLAAAQKVQDAKLDVVNKFLYADDKFLAFIGSGAQPSGGEEV